MNNDILEIPPLLKKLAERDKKEKPQRSVKERSTRISEIDGSTLELRGGFWWPVKSSDVAKESKKNRDRQVKLITDLSVY
jgi:hypothetical protein